MKALVTTGFNTKLFCMMIMAAAAFQSPLHAFQPNPLGEPDPDGSPVHSINVDFRAGMETGSGYAFRDAKAMQYRWSNGERFIRIDYTVANTKPMDLPKHAWQISIEGQTVGGITAMNIPKGQSVRFSKMIHGTRINDIRRPQILSVTLRSPEISGQVNPAHCLNVLQDLTQCERERLGSNCPSDCASKGLTGGTMRACGPVTDAFGCKSIQTKCDCGGRLNGEVFDSISPVGPLIPREPGHGFDPAGFRVMDIPPR